jgi:hypothetical protein
MILERFMRKITEIFVVLENRPGSMGEMCRVLKKKRVAIYAIGVFADTARLYVSKPEAATEALVANGFEVETRDVLRVDLPNRIGAMMELTTKLGNAGINIEYFYGTIDEKQRKGVVILEVDKPDLAVDIFLNHDF